MISMNYYYLVGPPGFGKLLLSKSLLVYASSLGLNATVTSVHSEQSNQSRGTHFHLLLKMTVNKRLNYYLMLEANQFICDLSRNNVSLAYLYTIDVLIIKEVGLLNSESHSTIELVLQHVIENDVKADIKLVINNKDPYQLMNITESSFWLSNYFVF